MRTKKTTILALAMTLITAIVLCSCNLDATDGIYSEVADSTESTNVTLKAFLGIYNDEYYYLSDDAVSKIGSQDPLFSSSGDIIIRGASLNAGAFLVLKENRSTLKGTITYYADATAEGTDLEGNFNVLLPNGLFYDSTNIYRYNGGVTAIVSDVTIQYTLVNGDYTFFSVKDGDGNFKFYVIKADGTVLFNGIEGSSKTYIGFQALPSGQDFILLNYDNSTAKSNLYLLANGESQVRTDVYTTLKSSIPYAYSTQVSSFFYNNGENNYIIFKCSSYFDMVLVSDDPETDGTVTQVSTGFAANLRTADITNILATDTDGIYIAGTVDSMLYRMDMPNDTSTQIR